MDSTVRLIGLKYRLKPGYSSVLYLPRLKPGPTYIGTINCIIIYNTQVDCHAQAFYAFTHNDITWVGPCTL
ncbi:MAG: hypothetical protein PHV06_04665, partial [bacterium]|nr:hypothetical protein [bacterium]